MQGFRFIGANQPFEHRHMEIEVRFASDRSYDDDDDDVLGGHGGNLDDFDPDNNPNFESNWEEAEYGLSGDDDDF